MTSRSSVDYSQFPDARGRFGIHGGRFVSETLMAALAKLRIDETARLHWLHAGAVPLGQELGWFYAALVRHLEADGVQPAGYVVVPTVLPVRPARAPVPAAPQATGPAAD